MNWLWWVDPDADFDPDDEPDRGRYDYQDDEPDTDDVVWPGRTFDEGGY